LVSLPEQRLERPRQEVGLERRDNHGKLLLS